MPAMIPPPQYDHTPAIPVIEHVLTAAEVNRLCHTLPGMTPAVVNGCARVNSVDGKCYIVRIDAADVRRHELAHCNGWPADHSGGHHDVTLTRDR